MAADNLFFAYLPNLYWSARLVHALTSNPALKDRASQLQQGPLRELQLAVTTKLKVLQKVVVRFEKHLHELLVVLQGDRARVQRYIGEPNSAYKIGNESLVWEIVLDIDSFLYETRSTYEIFGAFLREFFNRILGETITEQALKDTLEAQHIDTRWIEELREDRITFFHNTAPWIAADCKGSPNLEIELLILKKDAADFSDPSNYIRLESLRAIYKGFNTSQAAILDLLVSRIASFT